MKISIISTVYNKEKFLEKHIESLVSQTYDDIEFIFVDDASTDKSLSILKKYKKKNNKIKVFTQENSGPSYARKTGFEKCTGDLVYFVDSDDFLNDNNVIEDIVTVFKKHSKIDFLIGKMTTLYSTKTTIDDIIYDKKLPEGEYNISSLFDTVIRGSLCCKIFRTNKIDNSFFIKERNFEDSYLSYKYFTNSTKFYYLERVIYCVNKNDNSSLTTNISIEMLSTKYKVLEKLYNDIQFSSFIKSIRKLILKAYLDDLYYSLFIPLNEKRKFLNYIKNSKLIKEIMKKIDKSYLIKNKRYKMIYYLRNVIKNVYLNSIMQIMLRRRNG